MDRDRFELTLNARTNGQTVRLIDFTCEASLDSEVIVCCKDDRAAVLFKRQLEQRPARSLEIDNITIHSYED